MDRLPDSLAVVLVPLELPVVGPVVVLPDVEGELVSDVEGDGEDDDGDGDGDGEGDDEVVGVDVGDGVSGIGVGVEVRGGNRSGTFWVFAAGVLHFVALDDEVPVLL